MVSKLRPVISFFLLLSIFRKACGGAAIIPGGRRALPGDAKQSDRYAVIFDAGSTGSRVHVFCFDTNLDLVSFGGETELFVAIKPGLSAYANDPQAAANSLIPLLEEAKKVVPEELRPVTPVKLGATAGLRLLGEDIANQILDAVRNLLQTSSLEYKPEWVSVLAGAQEGSYLWVALNYLLGNLGKNYADTIGVIDQGGGSVQMAYTITKEAAANAPLKSDDPYVQERFLNGTNYHLYTHSYLHYGINAGRAEILRLRNGFYSNCILSGYSGLYSYGDEVFNASASPKDSSFTKCRSEVLRALKLNSPCPSMDCTFDGVWSGGGGAGQKNLYVASFFHDRASQVGFIEPDAPSAKARPLDFKKAAKSACSVRFEDARATYPGVYDDTLPFICMDLVFQYTLLVDGFGLKPGKEITLVSNVEYGGSHVEAAWPLGAAIEAVSQESKIVSIKYMLATAMKHLLSSIHGW